MTLTENSPDHFLDRGFTGTAGYGKDPQIITPAPQIAGELTEGGKCIGHQQDRDGLVKIHIRLTLARDVINEKSACPFLYCFAAEVTAIKVFTFQGKKEIAGLNCPGIGRNVLEGYGFFKGKEKLCAGDLLHPFKFPGWGCAGLCLQLHFSFNPIIEENCSFSANLIIFMPFAADEDDIIRFGKSDSSTDCNVPVHQDVISFSLLPYESFWS